MQTKTKYLLGGLVGGAAIAGGAAYLMARSRKAAQVARGQAIAATIAAARALESSNTSPLALKLNQLQQQAMQLAAESDTATAFPTS